MAALTHRLSLETVTIHLKLPRVFWFRMWLAAGLFRLGAKVLGVGIEIETDTGVLPDQPCDLPMPAVRPTRGRRPF
jgi:hypothetical protein